MPRRFGLPRGKGLSGFYSKLLGWKKTIEESDWILMRDPKGGTGMSWAPARQDRPKGKRGGNAEAPRRGGWMPTETHSEAMAAMRRFGIILGRPGDLAEPHGRLLELSAAPYSSG